MDDLDQDIGQALERLARSQPTRPALHVPGRASLTYADLGAQIRYVRERLGHWSIGRGDVIAGVIPTRPEMAVACATVPSAATLAPLSPDLTTDVYSELLARLRPKALLTRRGLDHAVRAAARRHGIAQIELLPDASAPAGVFTLELAPGDKFRRSRARVSPEIAYVLCTSGTTGLKKLVPLGHRQIILYSRSLCEWLQLSASDVGCHLQPMHLASGLRTSLIVSLLQGMSLVCLPEADVGAFYVALDEYRLTWLTTGFTVHRRILERASAHREVLARSGLRLLRAGSGRLEPNEIDRIEQLFRAPLLVSYTSSEALAITINPLPPRVRKRGSVGLPLCNEVAILGEAGAFCALGNTGEIVVRGPHVFEGYLDDPSLNAASFTNGWFRTGDLGRFDEDGYLYLVGRIKDIINRGGEKISPAEIDAAIEAHPGVQAAAAFGIAHPTLGEEVVAAVVRSGDGSVEGPDIIDQVRRHMGPKRVPRKIYFVDQLPRTEGGKILRSELPRLLGLDRWDAGSDNESAVDTPGPLSPLESALVGLWSSVLQVKSVGVNDEFFLLGGDSLRGAQLLTSVKAVFGVDLPIDLLLRNAATVAGMARAIEAARSDDSRVAQKSPLS